MMGPGTKRILPRPLTAVARLLSLVFLFAFGGCSSQAETYAAKSTFSFQSVVQEAKELSERPYKSPKGEVPDSLSVDNYDQWRNIRFKPDRSLWRKEGLPFTLQFFHPGLYYDRTVTLYIISPKGEVKPIPFSKDLYTYPREEASTLVPDNLGFAGFRVHHPINKPDYHDEVAVFVGASYFRAVGQNMNYGLSARGLAIDTVLPSGEEFPDFRKFWIHEPQRDAKDLSLYALLDGPSVTGAYHVVIHPGKETVIDVELTLFLRKPVGKLGIAPITSMFHHGENSYARVMDDFRPEIHDSDGLMLATSTGEWIWRPLLNPKTVLVNSFRVNNPLGFGLSQRDQDFDHYQDLESNYENRPSLWIRPVGSWGEGRVELIQIPTDKEVYDNIVAFFVPSKLPEKGEPLSFAYQMFWHYATESPRPPGGRVVATRTARTKVEGARKFVIDFAGAPLDSLPPDAPVEGVVTVGSGGKSTEQQVYKNRFTGGWRLVFQILSDEAISADKDRPKTRDPVELRAFIKLGDDVLTETWSYVYEP
jgi:periplasmic glucans biosynthesis protein